jgi:hypothetical protein
MVIDAGSGVLLIALGLFVLTVKPRRHANLALAAFGVGLGALQFVNNVTDSGSPEDVFLGYLGLPFMWMAGLALFYLALNFPRPLATEERRLVILPLAAYGINVARSLATATNAIGVVNAFLSLTSIRLVFAFALLLLALRFLAADSRTRARDRRLLVLMSAALLVYPEMIFGLGLPTANFDPAASTAIFGVGVIGLLVVLWLRNTRVDDLEEARWARNLALLTLGVPLLGMLLSAPLGGPGQPSADSGILGLTRVFMVAVLAYAILRYQLLDIDLKVKWTIKQSTLGAVFIGVFFVVSELAENVFSSTVGPYVGIAAAGALVFALAPLQHFAERVANTAMPGVRALGEMSHPERLALYRAQARVVWADGHLSVEERQILDIAREHLGLSLEEAMKAEREVAPPPATGGPSASRKRRPASAR